MNLLFYFSGDFGETWTLAYEQNDSSETTGLYDYPQIAVGNDGSGNYGLWFTTDYDLVSGDIGTRVGFIPTTGLNNYGTGSIVILPSQFTNIAVVPGIDVKEDGTVFLNPQLLSITNYGPSALIKKHPPNKVVTDPLDLSLFDLPVTITNVNSGLAPTIKSYPGFFYFPNSINDFKYDEYRKACYIVFQERPNDTIKKQDYYLFLIVSLDEGKTWSGRIQISDVYKNNRGFSSIALDPITHSMIVGWYDSRNSKTQTTEQYFGTYLSKKKLDKIVCKVAKNYYDK